MTAVLQSRELAARHFAVDMRHVEAKSGIVVGAQRTLVFDAGSDIEEGQAILELAKSLAPQPVLLAYSHGHWDHARGGPAFDGLEIIGHENAVPALRGQLPADRTGFPTRTFSGVFDIDLGDVSVQLREAPGHAPGSVVMWSPVEGILFAGDTVVTSIPPVFRDGNSVELEHTLRELAVMGINQLVPGHGAELTDRTSVAAALWWIADYIARVRAVTVDGIAEGHNIDQILARIEDTDAVLAAIDAPADRTLERHYNIYRDMFTELSQGRST